MIYILMVQAALAGGYCRDGRYVESAYQCTQRVQYRGNGGGPTRCADGTWSSSNGSGTCSWHGGIARGYGSNGTVTHYPASSSSSSGPGLMRGLWCVGLVIFIVGSAVARIRSWFSGA